MRIMKIWGRVLALALFDLGPIAALVLLQAGCLALVFFFMFGARSASAQVTMDVPFIPIGIAEAPDYSASGTISQVFVFQGYDEAGDPVYGVDSVEMANGDFGVVLANGIVSNSDLEMRFQTGFVKTGSNSYFYMPNDEDSQQLGLCQLDEFFAEETFQQSFSGVDLAHCLAIVAAALEAVGANPYVAPNDHVCDYTDYQVTIVTTSDAIRGSWEHAFPCDGDLNPEPDIDQVEPETASDSQMDYALDRFEGLLDELGQLVGECEAVVGTVLGDCQDKSDELTVQYETDGNIGDVTGGTTTPPTCYGDCTGAGGGDGGGEGVDICVEHPGILACIEVDEGVESDANSARGEADAAEDDLVSWATSRMSEFNSWTPGVGPDLMPDQATCPLVGGVESQGRMVLDYDNVCEVTGGPIRLLILALSYLSALLIVLRGISA